MYKLHQCMFQGLFSNTQYLIVVHFIGENTLLFSMFNLLNISNFEHKYLLTLDFGLHSLFF